MNETNKPIQAVPTNIITGFLGVGKTTSILHLLKHKPADQRWAVLVNEFGEIGVDGGLIQGHHGEEQGVFIREVPGGCMCCAAGLPMQVALNQLLSSAKPDRLLIEPTGLGHPKEVLQVLSGRSYQKVLSIQKIITLVNASQLEEPRYTENEIFNQQIEVADVIVGNKSDLYQPHHKDALQSYAQQIASLEVKVIFTVKGEIEHQLLSGDARYVDSLTQAESHHHHDEPAANSTMPDCGYVKKINQGEGYQSIGWRFREDKIFRRDYLFSFLNSISAERTKAVMNTENGVFGYNIANGAVTEVPLFGRGQSCIEIISSTVDEDWESELMRCLAAPASNSRQNTSRKSAQS